MAKLEAESAHIQASSPIPLSTDLIGDEVDDDALSELSEPPLLSTMAKKEEVEEKDEYELPPMKKARGEMSLEEYEAMLDAEEGPGGFLEGGDIVV